MLNRMIFAASAILLLAAGACAAPETPAAVETPTRAPIATVVPPEQIPTPTALLPAPAPTADAETEPAGASDQQAVTAIALETTAQALGVDQGTLRIVSIEAVEWRDSCLGVSITDQACAQVITPGYRVVVEAGDVSYAVHTNEDGSAVRFAGAVEPPPSAIPGSLGMVWNSSSEPCRTALITPETVFFGQCGGPLQVTPLVSQDLADDLAYYTSLYAPFEAQTAGQAASFHRQVRFLPARRFS